MLWNYAFLNRGLTLTLNGKPFRSENGLKDLLTKNLSGEPSIRSSTSRARTSRSRSPTGPTTARSTWSFVNGQHTTMGGTHLAAFREALVDTVRNFYKKDFDAADVRQSIDAAIVVRVQEPVFESQTKTKLGSTDMGPGGAVDPGIHRQVRPAEPGHLPAQESARRPRPCGARSRRASTSARNSPASAASRASGARRPRSTTASCATAGCTSATRTRRAEESTLFIVEGDSAAGSLTACRDVQTQAVFALKGKPLNTYGLTKKVIYENEEFHLLQSALNIEEGLDGLRYNRIVIATDADVDGMHIRLLLLSFFLQFFPELIRNSHLFILQTPLFRVRNKKVTKYCYSEAGEAGGHRRARRGHRDHPVQGPGRNLRGRVQGFHRREHPPRPGEPRSTSTAATNCCRSSWARTRPSGRNSSSRICGSRRT